MAVERGYPHRTCQIERLQHTSGVQARRYALIYDDAAPLVFAHGIGWAQILEADANDQIALRQIGMIPEHVDATDPPETALLTVTIEQRAEQCAFMQLDAMHP